MAIEKKYKILQSILSELGKVAVAFSAGVDSSLLLKVARDTLGKQNVIACMAIGSSWCKSELKQGKQLAELIDVELAALEIDVFSDGLFIANPPDRCYLCKKIICRELIDFAKSRDFGHVIFGTNFDDESDYRPGNRAITEFDIRCPLAEAKMTKDDIRQLSRQLSLPTADKPSTPCLVSRMEYGLKITPKRLRQIEEAESFLTKLGFSNFRVRHHDKIARIEVSSDDIEKIVSHDIRLKIIKKLKSLGFVFVSLDLTGFRSGSLNDSLTDQQKRDNL